MADGRDGPIYWFAPDPRAVLPLDSFRLSRSLRKVVERELFEVRFDTEFEAVMRACSARDNTWISEEIIAVYTEVFDSGYGHSVECWQGGELAGGLYGVAIGGAFFGESMFHRVTDASKVALVHLVRHLRASGFVLLDTQFSTPHLEHFGVTEMPRIEYEQLLGEAISMDDLW